MAERPASESSSDNFWPESSQVRKPGSYGSSKKVEDLNKFLHPLDDAPDFHDPYSDLNLFLSQKVKEECRASGFIKKWSTFLQETLIAKITPEFQKKFPNYRLGVSALRKTWKKIIYYTEQIQSQKDALTQEGKLNVSFLIKENLKQYLQLKGPSDFYPYQYAYQLAMKISDCVATLDGVRPLLDQLAKTIWFAQKHLLSAVGLKKTNSPHDEMDKWDKLIIKTLLEVSGKNPQATHKELEVYVKETLKSLQDLPSLTSLDRITVHLSALLAEKLYPTSSFHALYSSEKKEAVLNFIRSHLALYKKTSVAFNLSECARRLIAFYTLASKLPKNLTSLDSGNLDQSLMAFFSEETRLIQDVPSALQDAYEATKLLPELSFDTLEMIIWKILSKEESLLSELPYRIGQKIEEEIGNIVIDNPKLSFSSIVHTALQFFKKAKELTDPKQWMAIEKKISLWTMQGDLLCRWLHLDPENTLLKLICDFRKTRSPFASHANCISGSAQAYLRAYPEQTAYAPQVAARTAILYKYAWYALFSLPEESSLERFLEWHFTDLMHLREEQAMHAIEEICKKSIPLVPLDQENCRVLFRRMKQRLEKEVETENNERHA